MVSQCHFNLLFSCLEIEHLFLCFRSICFSFSVTIHMYCPFSTEFLSCSRSFLYTREISLCDMNYKSSSPVCHLCFDFAYYVYLAMCKFFIFILLSIFSFTVPRLFFRLFLKLFFFNKFIYLFLSVLGLRCCTRAFSSCGKRGLHFVAVHGFLIAVASLVVGHRL